jgi:hypothetical protein
LGAIFDPIDQPVSAAAHVLYAPGGEQHFARLARRLQFLAEHFEHVAPLRKLQDFAAVCTENLVRVDDVMESPKLVE